jgi:hypothetical protein
MLLPFAELYYHLISQSGDVFFVAAKAHSLTGGAHKTELL